MRRRLSLLLALLLLFAVSGCSNNKGSTVTLYFLQEQYESGSDGAFQTIKRVYEEAGKEVLVEEILRTLRSPPYPTCASPLFFGVRVLSLSVDGNSVSLDLSEEFRELSGVEISLSTAALVQTLCSADGIEYVRITCDGKPIEGRRDRYLSSFDFVTSTDVFSNLRYEATLYFPDRLKNALVSKMATITPAEDETLEQAIVGVALSGMEEQDKDGTLIPEGTELLSSEVKNRVCYLDFSAEFSALSEQRGKLVIYSIVNSLCKLDYIGSVQFLVGGQPVKSLAGVDTGGALGVNYDLVIY